MPPGSTIISLRRQYRVHPIVGQSDTSQQDHTGQIGPIDDHAGIAHIAHSIEQAGIAHIAPSDVEAGIAHIAPSTNQAVIAYISAPSIHRAGTARIAPSNIAESGESINTKGLTNNKPRYITNNADTAQDARGNLITSHRAHRARVKMSTPSTFFAGLLRMMRTTDVSETDADRWAMNHVFPNEAFLAPD
jgi:hypothetical protein